jgi:hypothetical protein
MDRIECVSSLSEMPQKQASVHQPIAPISIRPWMLNGLSERTLNAVRDEISGLDLVAAPGY